MSPVGRAMGTLERYQAVLGYPALYEIGAELETERLLGRNPSQPRYVLLAFAVLGRLSRSTIRAETDLADARTWQQVRALMQDTIVTHRLDVPPPGPTPPAWHHWRRWRDDHLSSDEGLASLQNAITTRAVDLAHQLGLLDPSGPGSLTHPHPSRALYGDGTIVRPIYAPPRAVRGQQPGGDTTIAYPDPVTGELRDAPSHRYDPDLVEHHGQAGPVLGHGYVTFQTRGPHHYQRVILTADHIPAPGQEANTAVRLLHDLYRHVGDGAHVVVYDGGLRGVHIDNVMTHCGWLVIAPVQQHQDLDDDTPLAVRTPKGNRARGSMIGTASHVTPTGTCSHQLAAIAGRLVVVDLDEIGDPVIVATPTRGAVKRQRRKDGHHHFNIGYTVPCANGDFTVWLTPHADASASNRPEHLRVIPEHDPDWLLIRGIRSDAEGTWSQLKRTLICDRAMSLGWRRGLIDLHTFQLLNNAYAHHRHLASEVARPGSRRLRLGDRRSRGG